MHYEQTVERLTPKQVALLGALKYQFVPSDVCAPGSEDDDAFVFTVTDEDGATRTAVRYEDARRCEHRWMLTAESVDDFVDTLGCRRRDTDEINYPLTGRDAYAFPVEQNDGCFHAFGGTYRGFQETASFVLDVDTSGRYQFVVGGDCGSSSSITFRVSALTMLDAGTRLLAFDSAGDEGSCPQIVYDVDEAGEYLISVETAGDAYLRVL